MKKFTALLLTIFMSISLAACGGNGSSSEGTSSVPESSSEKVSTSETKETAEETALGNDTAERGPEILVAYFSATGNTKTLAEYAADALGADLYEIAPEEPYTDDDLNYSDNSSRLSGKTIVPFCTSGGSGFGSSGRNLQALSTGDATWLDGARLESSSSREDIVEWINGLGLDVTAE